MLTKSGDTVEHSIKSLTILSNVLLDLSNFASRINNCQSGLKVFHDCFDLGINVLYLIIDVARNLGHLVRELCRLAYHGLCFLKERFNSFLIR